MLPEPRYLTGARVLVASCGSGLDVVHAFRAGAGDIHAVDISEEAVAHCRRVAESHGVPVRAEVMDLHRLRYPDGFFDGILGGAILHHLDLSLAAPEFARVLTPAGFAYFHHEPTTFNPLFELGFRAAFVWPTRHIARRLGFRTLRTPDERPLTRETLATLSRYFTRCEFRPAEFILTQKLSQILGGWGLRVTGAIDRSLVRLCPPLTRYGYLVHIWLER